MFTFQDLKLCGTDEKKVMEFVLSAIHSHKASNKFKVAKEAWDYYCQKNTTIMQYQKLLYTITGQAVPDNYSANYKICSNFFFRFITQESQYLLGNGVNWQKESTSKRLGDDFDTILQMIGRESLIGSVAFGFWNFDHVECFTIRDFVPLYDEDNGALRAGIRFWQIDNTKPLRATLYELDGYTDYIWETRDELGNFKNEGKILNPKRTYVQLKVSSKIDGTHIYDGRNYDGFPIVPMYGNPAKQSELVGIRQEIDAYDLIKSGFANNVDDASMIYWTIQNAGGMDDIDLVKFVERMKTLKAAVVEDNGAQAESHSLDVPYASREALLTRLRSDLYEDFMALDIKEMASGAVTATQIKASYEPLNLKTDLFEYQVLEFLNGLLKIVGIEDESPTFTRSILVNSNEEIGIVLQAAEYLPEEFITERIVTILGAIDQLEDIKKQKDEENIDRMTDNKGPEDLEDSENEVEEAEDEKEGKEKR